MSLSGSRRRIMRVNRALMRCLERDRHVETDSENDANAVDRSSDLYSRKRPDGGTAELFTHTNDDNKDHDTCVDVSISTQDGSSVLADVHNADCSGRDATEYNDGSEHVIKLLVEAAGAAKTSCQGFTVTIGQHPNGHDTWKFNAKVTLYFSDGTTLVKGQDGIELHNEDSKAF